MLKYKDVSIQYGNTVTVSDFNLEVGPGQIVSIVGESGSGKTTAIRAALGLLPANGKVCAGDIQFNGASIVNCTEDQKRNLRGLEMAMIFQDSGAMINPIRRIGDQFIEYILVHEPQPKEMAHKKAEAMLQAMRLPDPSGIMACYPFELSGGMRQRVGIALAMTFQPKILLADEPTSALDVTTQAQIVRQMMELRDNYGTSIVIVTHNLGVAAYMSDHIVVMQEGRIVEQGNREAILEHPTQAYTQCLLSAVPTLEGERYV